MNVQTFRDLEKKNGIFENWMDISQVLQGNYALGTRAIFENPVKH